MAVQKSKKSKSKSKIRRSCKRKINFINKSIDFFTKEIHMRHRITKNGYYKGKLEIKKK